MSDHPSARLLNHQAAGGLVPDLLAIVGAGRRKETEHHVTFACREDREFGLTVHPHRGGRDVQVPRQSVDVRHARVARLIGTQQPRRRWIRPLRDP